MILSASHYPFSEPPNRVVSCTTWFWMEGITWRSGPRLQDLGFVWAPYYGHTLRQGRGGRLSDSRCLVFRKRYQR